MKALPPSGSTLGDPWMALPTALTPAEEQRLYPVHEEDNVPETSPHEFAARYVRDVLGALFPESLVTGNICLYWERGNMSRYVAADAILARDRPRQPLPRNYLLWNEPPVNLVVEIGSDSTRQIDLEEKPAIYAENVRAEEYLYADPPDPETPRREIYLWRLGPQGYVRVEPEPGLPADGGSPRLQSDALGVEFGFDATGMLRIYVHGIPQPTHEEEKARREAAEARAAGEAARATEEASLRQAAEARATEEASLRQVAEARATEEAARAADLERQLAELRAKLQIPEQ
jgi:Uma2 family endonuclease